MRYSFGHQLGSGGTPAQIIVEAKDKADALAQVRHIFRDVADELRLLDDGKEWRVSCPGCARAPSERLALRMDGHDPFEDSCDDPVHDLADQLVADLFDEASALGIPHDAATVREAVRAAKKERADRTEDR